MPYGIIHADLFIDNIFFQKNKFHGYIDFYFACNDFLCTKLLFVLMHYVLIKKIINLYLIKKNQQILLKVIQK